jgi:hypothetical protein
MLPHALSDPWCQDRFLARESGACQVARTARFRRGFLGGIFSGVVLAVDSEHCAKHTCGSRHDPLRVQAKRDLIAPLWRARRALPV